MQMVEENIVKTYTVQYQSQDYHRNANIIFENGIFKKCLFKTADNPYNSIDWHWLAELAKKVIELIEKEEKENL